MKNNQLSQSTPSAASGKRNFMLSLIIPCYNESSRVDIMMSGLADFEEKWKGNYEVIVVDDGSKDDTSQKVTEAVATKYHFLKDKLTVEKLPANQGKGGALKRGVSLAKGDFILTLDADMSTKPTELINWERKEKNLFSGDQVVYIGSRKHDEGKVEALLSRKLIGGVFNNIVQVLTTLRLNDTQCGFKLYSRDVAHFLFGSMQSKGWSHDVELLYQADLNNIRIVEMPIYWVNMPESKVNVVVDSMKMFFGVLTISLRTWVYNTFRLPFKIPAGASNEQKEYIRGRMAFNILALLLIIVMPGISFHYGVNGDEHCHFDYGNSIYNYFFHGATDAQTGILRGDPEGRNAAGINYYGGVFDFITAFAYNVFRIWDHYTTMHFINALVGAIGIIFAGKIAKMLGGWGAAILTVVFLVLSPSWFGHNFANPKDIPFSVGYTAGVYYILLFLKSLPNPGAKPILGMALSIGWAMGVRIGGLLLIAYLLLFIVVYALYTKQLKLAFSKQMAKRFFIVAAAGYFIAILFWPYSHLGIVSKPLEALKIMSNFFVNISILYDGHNMLSNQVQWYYIPRYIAYTAPLIVLAGSAIGLIVILLKFKKDRMQFLFASFLLFAMVFPLAYAIYKHSSLYDGWRHFLFIYPPLAIVAAMGWSRLIGSAQKTVKYTCIALVAAGLTLPVKYVIANHPYEALYFNEIAGGIKGIYGKYDTDYYMIGIKEATEWLLKNEHIGDKKVIIGTNTTYPMLAVLYQENRKNIPLKYQTFYERYASFARDEEYEQYKKDHPDFVDPFNPAPIYVRYGVRYSKDWDYYVGFSRFSDPATLTSGNWPSEDVIYTVKVDGVPIAAVLKRKTKKDFAGFELMKDKKYLEAKDAFLASLREYPGNETVWSELARIYDAEGKPDSAIYAGYRVLDKTPGDIYTYQMMGEIFTKQKKVDSAMKLFDKLATYDASNSHFLKGYAYAVSGNVNAAYGELDEAIATNPYNQQAYRLAMQIAEQTKDMGRLEEYNSKVEKAFPQKPEE